MFALILYLKSSEKVGMPKSSSTVLRSRLKLAPAAVSASGGSTGSRPGKLMQEAQAKSAVNRTAHFIMPSSRWLTLRSQGTAPPRFWQTKSRELGLYHHFISIDPLNG